ncbi:MAG: hypothetical protein U5N85_07465 [Arcicella sp.]|nr:hypothetical protein [Arcicella sp.]
MDYFSREDEAAQLGVNIAGAIEGGYSLAKGLAWLKNGLNGLKSLFGLTKSLKSFSGVEKAWQSEQPQTQFIHISAVMEKQFQIIFTMLREK